jgi:MFS family permease
MGIASAVIGILPGTEAIGVAAPLLLVTLRVPQGIAVGGEWSGSVLLTMEWGDQKRRGLLGSFAQIGVPVGDVIRRHWREILLSAGLRFAEQMPFYLFTTFVLIYVVQRHHYSKTFVLTAVLVGAAVELATIPYFSHLSDSLGRKRIYLTGAVIAGLFAFPYFAVLTYGGPVLIFVAIVLSMIVHSMMYGPQAALIGESFPTHLRYGGAGLGYQLASVFAGGPAPLVATWLLHETGTSYSISVYIVVAAVITVVCCLALPDRSRVDIDDSAVYSRA